MRKPRMRFYRVRNGFACDCEVPELGEPAVWQRGLGETEELAFSDMKIWWNRNGYGEPWQHKT